MAKRSRLLRIQAASLAAIAVFAIVAFCAGTLTAQSGRRVPKSKSAPPPEPQSVPAETKPAEKAKPTLSLIVGINRDLSFLNIPSYFSDSVLRACVDRLDDYPSVEVDVAPRDVNRGEAAKRAKAEKEAYVVWLNLREDSMSDGGRSNFSDIYIQYVVFTPQTAKVATSGQTYQQSFRSGGVIGLPRTSGAASEYALKQAAREAAERILAAIKSHTPGDRVPG
ncbi:MAG: hypothetical protein ACR2G5_02635 [Pyrinomonadaceae bacterium]